jgi:D-methionine transport system ATP-binding protein
LIDIKNVSKSFGDLKVIRDVSIHIRKGEIFGIIGHSGAGKSTLLRCINGLETFESGDILVDELSVRNLDEDEIRYLRKRLSMIFQGFNLLNLKTAYENVALPMEIWGYDKEEIRTRTLELLRLVGLEDKAGNKPRALSGGEKQRVAIARALSMNPEVLLCDEATSALDPKTTKEILQLLNRINRELGITIVIVTHQMEVVKDVCERVALMENGKVLAQGEVGELFLTPGSELKTLLAEDDWDHLPAGTNIRIAFTKEYSNERIITAMARELQTDFSIVWGKLEKFRSDVLGNLVINIDAKDKENIIQYLEKKGLSWEVLTNES